MRNLSAAQIKGRYACGCPKQRPDPESRLGMLYDAFKNNAGKPIPLKLSGADSNYPERLIDFYGLDIRRLQRGDNRTKKPSIWVLAGEWFGREYRDLHRGAAGESLMWFIIPENWSQWTFTLEWIPSPLFDPTPRKSADIIHMSQEDFRKGHERKKNNGSKN